MLIREIPWQMLNPVLPSNLPSVKFRVLPWQMLTLILPSNLPSVRFRVHPWQMLTLVLPLRTLRLGGKNAFDPGPYF